MRRAALVLLLPAMLGGCFLFRRAPQPVANPHYVLGAGYQLDGHWYYPDESYSADQTGIAAIDPPGHPPLTVDGELYDAGALAAAHQTLQLPAILRVTNLDNGRQIDLRLNDRGPASPGRVLSVTPRAAALLGMNGPARVRLQVLAEDSHAAVDGVGGAPKLALSAAPRDAVQATDLSAPGGPAPVAATPAAPTPAAAATPGAIPRMPERVFQLTPNPGVLMLSLGTFDNPGPAGVQASRAGLLGATVSRARTGRSTTYTVEAGPYATVDQADAALDRALRAGVTDARIVVE